MRKTPRLSVTAWLTLLILGAVVPLLVFGGLALRGIMQTSRALADRGQADTARALALAVDGEVRSWKASLAALAESKSAQPGRWAEFYEEARQVGAQHEGWVVLTVASGEQLFNTLRPYGTPLLRTSSPETIDAVFREGKPIVSDVIWGQNAQRYLVAVAVPVVRGGKVVNCLTLNISPDRLTRLLLRQQLPPSWVAAINDRGQRVVARSVLADAHVGKPTVVWLTAATQAAGSGIVTGPLTDGRSDQVAFERLQEVPWVMALAVPVVELQLAAPVWGFLFAGGVLGLVAVGMAVYMGRKVTRPMTGMARASALLLRGEVDDLRPRTGIREVHELQEAFIATAAAIRVHAEERERAAEALRQANQALEARVVERTAALAGVNEALRAANAGLQDEIVQRKRAEEEIRTVARFPSENPNPVLRLDSDGRILFANAASTPLLDQWGAAVGSQAPAPWPATARDVLTGQSSSTVELGCGDRTYVVFVAPVPEAGYVNLYSTDITERKRAEAALRQLNVELEQRVAARTADLSQAIQTLERQATQLRGLTTELTFAEQRERRRLADVLHDELQQILVATRLRAHMLARAEDATIRQGSQEIVELIEEALAATRSLTAELSPPALRMGHLQPALEWLTHWMQERHKFTVRLQPSAVPLCAPQEGISVLVYQAVRELLLNVVKHARVDAANVTVTQDAAALTLTVADEGVGFDPTSLRIAGGTEGGYGLLGIRERLESVGGRLEIAAAAGKGSQFTVIVPLPPVPTPAPTVGVPGTPAAVSDARPPAGRRTRVLVVDDHALVRRGFATMLGREPDLEVVGEADNGQRAVELTRQLNPDVIVMDVSMPVMNGIDATREILAEFPATRVIGLSMFEDPEQPEAMRQAGAVGYLSKNDSAEALLAAIRGGGAPAA